MVNLEEFDPYIVEKVYRLSDILQRISQIPLLKKHLVFVGGTALNMIVFSKIDRLSVDIDFNFRIRRSQEDW